MIEIPRGRNWQLVHTITDDGTVLSDMRELQDGELLPVPVRCQLRGKTAVRNAAGYFELPLITEIPAGLTGDIGEILTLSLDSAATKLLHVGEAVLDVVAIWSDHEEELLVPEVVAIVNWPTVIPTLTDFPSSPSMTVPSFVDDFEEALAD